jgi:acetolactate synthase regulatory subunit
MNTNAEKFSANSAKNASVPAMIVSDKAVRLLASAIFRQLQDEGCMPKDIISVSSQLIDLVTSELQKVTDVSAL